MKRSNVIIGRTCDKVHMERWKILKEVLRSTFSESGILTNPTPLHGLTDIKLTKQVSLPSQLISPLFHVCVAIESLVALVRPADL